MISHPIDFTKVRIKKRILHFEIMGFLLAVFTCWMTELLDPPFSISQVLTDSSVIIATGFFVIYWTRQLLMRIKYLERSEEHTSELQSL
jgi:hypothetical protein